MAKVCEALGRLWSKHLETFRTRDGESYLSRNDGRDHFFARNRAWHYAEPKSLAEDLDLADRRDVQGDECAWTREGVTRNAARLMLETQAPRAARVSSRGVAAWRCRGEAVAASSRRRPSGSVERRSRRRRGDAAAVP